MHSDAHVKKILIIGAGNLGTSLFRVLNETQPGSVYLYGKQAYTYQNQDYIPEESYTHFLNAEIINKVSTIIICVQDDRIKEATRAFLLYKLNKKVILHTSGAKDAAELEHLKNRGAYIASLHPLQSFATKFADPRKWHHIVMAFQGDKECYNSAKEITNQLSANLIVLNEDQKIALHIAGVVAANYLVALLSISENILGQAGINQLPKNEIIQPLLNGVAENYKENPVESILSGPLKRGDVNVLRKHIQYLRIHKSKDADLYLAMAKTILNDPKFEIPGSAKIEEILDKYS